MKHFLTLRRQTKDGRKKIYRDSLFLFNEEDYTVIERYEFYDSKNKRIYGKHLDDRVLSVETKILGMSHHINSNMVIFSDLVFIKTLCEDYIENN